MSLPTLPFVLPGFTITQARQQDTYLVVEATSVVASADCPTCHQSSTRVHSRYLRTPRDLPGSASLVRLWLTVRRFLCANNACPQRTFVARFPDVVPFRARRTQRLTRTLQALVATLSAKAGARLAANLFIGVSHDTLTRLLRDTHPSAIPTPRVLGVDDFAFKKGHCYGTILVDLERHQPVDLLPDRTADTLAAWLRAHPGIEIIARDRSMEYARGATLGAPAAQQVADRWHLLRNARDAVEHLCSRLYTTLQHLPPERPRAVADAAGVLVIPIIQALRPVSARERVLRTATQARRAARYDQARTLIHAGIPHLQIAQQLRMSRSTVRRFAAAETVPERAPRARQARMIDDHMPYLVQRWQAGCTNASQLWRELRDRGYGGARKQVARWVQQQRRVPAPTASRTAQPVSVAAHITGDPYVQHPQYYTRLPSPRHLTWLLLHRAAPKTDEARQVLVHIRQHPQVLVAQTLAQQFHTLLCQRRPDDLDGWLHTCTTSGIPELQAFAAGLRADESAIRAACREEWSTGQVEGQNTRLKLLKREMYGRATFAVLRQRVLAIM